ncbi:MAG: FHA domain-containing protein [Chloroflexi bacterium]|nr:FHA domain-containing protein [Chloroflexota bacterium]MCI0579021.1 FHA domain-containing protein [Chloroflexota bacterium]MCI0646948.1 FHA domain-containing protein [Chloroflexota bacterium]MCI0730018.1 FHA domain-containing protein [Chloroflexota bacterium]
MSLAEQLIGQVINNFEIQDVIGRGGMGLVYRAYHPDLQRYAAVKVMRPELANQPGFYERFLQEARTAARLEHPNIVDVINFGRFGDSFYLMMDYIDGPSLRQLIIEHRDGLPLWDAAQIFWQIADVLIYSHAQGVLHRDLKPDNILLTHSIRPNRPYRAVVTDFGLVKLVQNSILETQEGISVGTPAYMSPEQCRGEDVDGRTDIYALGVMLYEAVTGQRPYPIRGLFDAAKFHASGKLIAPRALNSAIPLPLDILIRRMLIPDVSRRIGSAAEVVDALQELITILSKSADGGPVTSRLQRRITQEGKLPRVHLEKTVAEEEEPSTPAATSGEAPIAPFYIQVAYQEEWEDKMYPLSSAPVQVGRLASSSIVLDRPDRYISKKHCEIVIEEGRVLIRDLGSTNGTILNDEKLKPNIFHEWPPGVEVRLGPFTLALRTDKEVNALPSPPAEGAPPRAPTTKIHFYHFLSCVEAIPTRLPLAPDRALVIGRAADCDMVLDHPHVSKHHCRIQLGEAGPEIVDLRSTNGTFLNEQRLPAHVPIPWKDATTINVGPFTVTLEDHTPQTS